MSMFDDVEDIGDKKKPSKIKPVYHTDFTDDGRELNMSEELRTNYLRIQALISSASIGDEEGMDIKEYAALMGRSTEISREIIKQQQELHNVARYRKMEAIVLRIIATLPKETQLEVIATLEKELDENP